MTPTPPSATSSRGENSPDFRVVRKRNRVPLSCAPCRNRKLKCNRQSPCDNCIKRGDSISCAYAAPAARKRGGQAPGPHSTPDDMQNRIDRLEGLVLSLVSSGSQPAGPTVAAQALSHHSGSIGNGSLGPHQDTPLDATYMMDTQSERGEEESETDGVTTSMGILKVDAEQQKTVYIGEAHWAALLNEIGEVKNYFSQHRKEFAAQMEKVAQTRKAQGGPDIGSGPALLFGASVPPSRNEILRELPSRYICDILIGRYFNTFDPSTHILHGPTFQRQYNTHWTDSSKTSIVWIGMLFAMLRLAMISYGREGDEPPEFRGKCQDMASTYRTQMAHCMILADYTKPHNFLIETLIFHMHAEYTSNRDTEASVWVLAGMIARLAMRMGYHRDSKMFPNVTPFQGEMRRRVWTFVRSADLLFSFQLALPSMIRIGDSDTELPRNIYDDEFDEESKELPPPRPASEATPISYMIAKGRLAFGFGRVLEEVNGVDRHGYDEILKIDKGLQEIYQSIPDHLKLRPMSEQQVAPMSLIIARFSLATVYHKSQCVLHRRFVRLAKGSNKYMHSRRTCIDSAMQLLGFQATQHKESQDRGRMRTLRNHTNSLTTHDFLLAASVLVMDLYSHRESAATAAQKENGANNGDGLNVNTPGTSITSMSGASGNGGSSASTQSQRSNSVSYGGSTNGEVGGAYISGLSYTRDDLLKALEHSQEIWFSNRDLSMEAYKASELLTLLIHHIRLPYGGAGQGKGLGQAMSSVAAEFNGVGVGAAGAAGAGSGIGVGVGVGNGGIGNDGNDEQTAAMTLGMLQAGGMAGSGGAGVPQTATASTAAQMAQQAQLQGAVWDGNAMGNAKNGGNPLMNAFLNGGSNGQNFGAFGAIDSGAFGGANTTAMFSDALFGGVGVGGGMDMNMNFDWDTWDNYMQPSNLSLDPAANLWSSGSPGNNNNMFAQQTPSSESNASNTNDTSFGMNSNYMSQNQMGGQGQSMVDPHLSKGSNGGANGNMDGGTLMNNSNGNRNENGGSGVGTGGDAFMGAETPGSGSMGRGAWRWAVGLNGEPRR